MGGVTLGRVMGLFTERQAMGPVLFTLFLLLWKMIAYIELKSGGQKKTVQVSLFMIPPPDFRRGRLHHQQGGLGCWCVEQHGGWGDLQRLVCSPGETILDALGEKDPENGMPEGHGWREIE